RVPSLPFSQTRMAPGPSASRSGVLLRPAPSVPRGTRGARLRQCSRHCHPSPSSRALSFCAALWWEDARVDDGIRYVRNGGVAVAYQVVGEGEVDLVFVPPYASNLVYGWVWSRWRVFYERLARSFRLILFDKRGTGLSDRGGQFAALETRMEDLRAVLDA